MTQTQPLKENVICPLNIPPLQKKRSQPIQNILTYPDFFVYSSLVFVLLSACLVEFIYKHGQHCDIATCLGTILKQI